MRLVLARSLVARTIASLALAHLVLGLAGIRVLAAAQSPSVTGSWHGTLEVGGTALRLVFHLDRDSGGGLAATMDSPDQGATGIPVTRATLEGDSLQLEVASIGGRYAGRWNRAADRIEGRWFQSGRSWSLALSRGVGGGTETDLERPQVPESPYPYRADSIRFEGGAPDVRLAGTLTVPDGPGPHPALVLVSGSGPQDRNSTVFGHPLFLVLADHLTREGVAVLRYDERGVGASTGRYATATIEEFAADASAAVEYLHGRPEIDADRIGLYGHSEGGLVAPLVAARRGDLGFLILVGAPAVDGREVLIAQSSRIAQVRGASEEDVDSVRALQERLFTAVFEESDSASIARRVRDLLEKRGLGAEAIENQIREFTRPWLRHFLTHEPAGVLEVLDLPVRAYYGARDLQVTPAQNAPLMRELLGAGDRADRTVRVLEGLNHLLQPAETGLPSEYRSIETTIAPEALAEITDAVPDR